MWLYTGHRERSVQKLAYKIINAPGNGITIRADIHREFDSGRFAFVVKDGALVCHFLDVNPQLADLYHNAPVTLPDDVPLELMYARFAWAVIEQAGSGELCGLPLVSPVPGAARAHAATAQMRSDGEPERDEEVDVRKSDLGEVEGAST